MNNEPVAYRHWMIDEEFPEDSCWEYFDAPTGEDCKECIPLYTHPAKPLNNVVIASATCSCGKVMEVTNLQEEKTLTDEEIRVVWYGHPEFKDGLGVDPIPFAKAILRKAQEK